MTRHREKQYPDTHLAIIERQVWDRVPARLNAARDVRPASPKRGEAAHLEGKVFDDRGNAMVPVHTTKGQKRYRYYLSRAKLL